MQSPARTGLAVGDHIARDLVSAGSCESPLTVISRYDPFVATHCASGARHAHKRRVDRFRRRDPLMGCRRSNSAAFASSAAECRGIRTAPPCLLPGPAKARLVWRRNGRRNERRCHAAGLLVPSGRAAVLERAADVLAFGHGDVRSRAAGRDDLRLDRFAVDLVANQLSEHAGPCEWPISTTPRPLLSFFR